ncbi:DUF4153 domain-containing protein [Algoriphagus hitonicola]|uniref:DUF4153 domain-containing protein n=1 Tax=Algoriphagus hitonicola TaxID=435880 RepID=A0A1I2STZ0_9BACT|nr:DUF4153 domain-containing protein [Algoriphagus hitonicola]SFG56068.1 protein of unknown function [Algoriphagus hitonicola]
MKNQILSNLHQAEELEKLYRKSKSEFKTAFNDLYPEIKGRHSVEFWNARLNFSTDSVGWGSIKDWRFLIILALIAWIFAKSPQFFSWNEEFFYPRNMGFLLFPFVSLYFIRKKQLSLKSLWLPIVILGASMIYINLLPQKEESDTLILACIHLPLLLWAVLGFVFGEAQPKNLLKRLEFLNFNGDAVIMGAVLGLAGMLLSGITIGLFNLIGLEIGEFYFENIGLFGLVAAPLIATHLTQTNPQLVNKVPPIIAKIFAPLVLIMLLFYLGAIVYAGKDPYNDREFLLLFNLLLIGVMALIFFSVTESAAGQNGKTSHWILVLLSITTVLVNLVALSAIAFRITEYGITPNRLAVLGVNILMLVHLVLVCKKLITTLRKDNSLPQVGLVVVNYLPVYVLWTMIVVFVFPWAFGFE